MIDIIGYLGLALTVLGLTRDNITMLRVIGILGCCAFLVQAVLLKSAPLVATNLVIICLHLSMLYKARNNFK